MDLQEYSFRVVIFLIARHPTAAITGVDLMNPRKVAVTQIVMVFVMRHLYLSVDKTTPRLYKRMGGWFRPLCHLPW